MTVRLRVKNGAQELVVSSEGRLPYCVGKATFQALVQPAGSVGAEAPGRVAGYSTYQVAHAGPVIPVFDMPIGFNVGVISVTEISAGLHEIKMYCGMSPDTDGFETQYVVDVWAYGFAAARAGAFGLVLRDADSGVIAADFTRDAPLFPRGSGDIYATPTGFSAPSLTRAVGLGMPAYWAVQETARPGSGSVADHYEYQMFWRRASITSIVGITALMKQYRLNTETPTNDGDDGPGVLFVLEGAPLP